MMGLTQAGLLIRFHGYITELSDLLSFARDSKILGKVLQSASSTFTSHCVLTIYSLCVISK